VIRSMQVRSFPASPARSASCSRRGVDTPPGVGSIAGSGLALVTGVR
jgi:hypothetical protein